MVDFLWTVAICAVVLLYINFRIFFAPKNEKQAEAGRAARAWFAGKSEEKAHEMEGQIAMPNAPTGEIYIRAVLDIEQRALPKGIINKRVDKYSVIVAHFDFSPHAVHQILHKNLMKMVFAYTEPVSKYGKQMMQENPNITNISKDGMMAVPLGDIVNYPKQLFYYERYDEATLAMDEIKSNLKKLKEFCMHGQGATTNKDVFEA